MSLGDIVWPLMRLDRHIDDLIIGIECKDTNLLQVQQPLMH